MPHVYTVVVSLSPWPKVLYEIRCVLMKIRVRYLLYMKIIMLAGGLGFFFVVVVA